MRIRKSFIIGIIITLLLLLGVFVAFYLSQKPQEVRQRASGKAFGKALQFGTETQQLPIGDILSHNSQPFTVDFWLNHYAADTQDAGPRYLISTDSPNADPSCTSSFSVFYNDSTTTPQTYKLSVGLDSKTYSPSENIPIGQWTHIAFTVKDSQIELFVNGKHVANGPLPAVSCFPKELTLGGAKVALTSQPNLTIDELRISNDVEYTGDFTPSSEPYTPGSTTLALWHFDGDLKEEFTGTAAQLVTGYSFVDSSLPVTTTPPVCQPNVSTCEWDTVDTAVSYHYVITKTGKDTPIAEGDVQAPLTSTTFVSEDNATYTCSVTATNACGTGDKASATATCSVPTATPTPLPSSTPTPTNSPTPTPTSTPSPTPTTTPVPSSTPTPTKLPTPTPTQPPLATNTPIPTNTPVPTNTPGPVVATNTPTPTLPSPGSPIETITIAGGIILTIIGALLLFAL